MTGLDLLYRAAAGAESLVRIAGREVIFSTVVFAVVLVLWLPLRRRSPALGYALWSLVFLRLVLPPGLTHPLSAGVVLGDWLDARPAAGTAAELSAADSTELLGPEIDAHAGTPGGGGSFVALGLVALWLQGLGVWWLFYLRRLGLCRRLVREAARVEDGAVAELAAVWRRRLGIRRRLELRLTASRISPFTLGIRRPVVVLPRVLVDSEGPLESALAHELAHVARWDSLWLRLQQLVQALYFFHPVAWLAGRVLTAERERLCDERVLSLGVLSRRDYAASLVTVLKLEALELGVPRLWTPKRRLTMRIRSILTPVEPSRLYRRGALAAVLVLGAVLLPLAGAPEAGESAGPAPAPVPAPSPDPTPEAPAAPAASPRLANPLPNGRVSSRFGDVQDPWTHEVVHHDGIDVAADVGTSIVAPAAGVVEVATTEYTDATRGTVVVLDHGDGWKTLYSHLSSFNVEAGQRVAEGDPIGKVGNTGRSTGPHLHFEAWHDGAPVDPALLVGDWR